MNTKQTYSVAKDGKTMGPYSREVIQMSLKDGRLSLDDHLLDPSTNEWVTLSLAGLGQGVFTPPLPPLEGASDTRKNSVLGTASLIISIISVVAVFTVFIIEGIMDAYADGWIEGDSAGANVTGFLFLLSLASTVLALGLGIGGLFQKHQNKVFAVIGTVISSLTFLLIFAAIIAGSLME